MRDRLARAGGAGDQQVRHLREIRAHRRAADVLAERERQRRCHVVVRLRLDDLAERDDLALLVRDLQTHDRLAGNHFHDAHADGGQRAREILGEAGDLAHLDAGRRTHLEARDHRARLHGHDFHLDAEILELELDQARHRLERFLRIAGLARRRIVEQLERRQLARLGRVEHRHLALFLDALALLDHRRRRLDARLDARGRALLFDLGGFDARLLGFEPTATSRATLRRALIQPMAFQMPAPIRSTMVSQETPKASDTPAIQAVSMNSVAPRKFRPTRARCRRTARPRRPRSARSRPALQCSVASPQLANSISVKPPMRTAVLARVRPSSSSRCRNITKQATPSIMRK